MGLFSPNAQRIPEHTPLEVNRSLQWQLAQRLRYYAEHPEEIDRRLKELAEEWDLERAMHANAAGASLIGFWLGRSVSRLFFLLPLAIFGMVLQHVVSGWTPMLPFMRRRGFRTQREIEAERHALLALREGIYVAVEQNGHNGNGRARWRDR
jgi:hypothetical protein